MDASVSWLLLQLCGRLLPLLARAAGCATRLLPQASVEKALLHGALTCLC
jgi:hypothetical protein